MKTIAARDLIEGAVFRKPGQRKWRIAASVNSLEAHLTDNGKPGVLIGLHDCSQLIFGEDYELELPTHEHDMDRDGFIKLRGRRRQRRVH